MPRGGTRLYVSPGTYGYVKRALKNARYSCLSHRDEETGKNFKVHRFVCEAFHGPAPFDGAIVIHLDENAHNNRPENLKWGTHKENQNMPKVQAYRRRTAKQKLRGTT